MSFEEKLNEILSDSSMFSGEKKVAVLKAIATEKCRISSKRRRILGEDVALIKKEKCVKRKVAELWWTMLRQHEPVTIKNILVTIKGSDIQIEKTGE